ncbi:immunoglobulin domain protein [Ancylostoma ceylanicum]|uniref:Immunoglobulin domain protein n=1 Tax=Ancylostoma ceylanicum TaxID=53326 RepID=A0A0D6LDH4_9BILA|nr:immunoglobulin domain protein [Ancylostoma ceylanicum]
MAERSSLRLRPFFVVRWPLPCADCQPSVTVVEKFPIPVHSEIVPRKLQGDSFQLFWNFFPMDRVLAKYGVKYTASECRKSFALAEDRRVAMMRQNMDGLAMIDDHWSAIRFRAVSFIYPRRSIHLRPSSMPVGKFATAYLLVAAATLCGAVVDWASIATPPRFVHEQNEPILYFKVEKHGTEQTKAPDNLFQVTINCVAEANPDPSYRWTKNGKTFNVHMYSDKVVQKPGEGTLVFSKLDESDAGVYRCEASNDNGTAVSRPTRLEQTWIRHFPIIEPEVVRVELGDPYSRNCTPPVSNPTARVYWILKGDEGTAVTFESINSSHISSNEQASHESTSESAKESFNGRWEQLQAAGQALNASHQYRYVDPVGCVCDSSGDERVVKGGLRETGLAMEGLGFDIRSW